MHHQDARGIHDIKKKKKELALAGEGREDLMYVDTSVAQAPGLLRVARLNPL